MNDQQTLTKAIESELARGEWGNGILADTMRKVLDNAKQHHKEIDEQLVKQKQELRNYQTRTYANYLEENTSE